MDADHTLYDHLHGGARQQIVKKAHTLVQGTIESIGVDRIVREFRLQSNDSGVYKSPGSTIYADEHIDCFTVPPGFIDRICRQAGVGAEAQRMLFNSYYHAVETDDIDVPVFEDILVVDKKAVSAYDEDQEVIDAATNTEED